MRTIFSPRAKILKGTYDKPFKRCAGKEQTLVKALYRHAGP